MIYNEKRKQEFINQSRKGGKSHDDIVLVLTKRFKETAPFEEKLERDLCEWVVPDILDFYKSRVNRSLESLMMIHSQFNMYAKWCLMNSLIPDSQNHFSEIDREILQSECVNQAYYDIAIMNRDEVIKLTDYHKIKNAYERFLILALFEGLGGKGYSDFENLTMENFSGNIVKLPSRTIAVSDKLIELAEKSAGEYEYHSYGNVHRKWDYNVGDNKIIKTKSGSRLDVSDRAYMHSMSVNLKRLFTICDNPSLSSSILFESGRLQMIRDFMKRDKTDADTIISKYGKEIQNQYGKIYAKARYLDKWRKFLELTD